MAIPVRLAPVATFMAASADHALDIMLQQRLEHGPGHRAMKVALIMLLQKLDQGHVGRGHRGSHRFAVEACTATMNRHHRWPPRLHRKRGDKVHHVLGHYQLKPKLFRKQPYNAM